jgi:signal peptidase I
VSSFSDPPAGDADPFDAVPTDADIVDSPVATETVPESPKSSAAVPPAGKKHKHRNGAKTALEWVLLIVGALVIALLIKTFLFQAFYIPSESMVPTLEKNDRVLVNKLSYKLHDVNRGDIIVFKAPEGTDPTVKDLVKRVIALPGETVSAENGKIFIDGKELKESYLPDGTISNCASFTEQCFPTGKIPPDHYWMMGDNRASSKDSRHFGPIEKSAIIGRVFVRIWPLNRLDLL